jgi:hypothetical protein
LERWPGEYAVGEINQLDGENFQFEVSIDPLNLLGRLMLGAMRATEDAGLVLYPMADHPASAVNTRRSQHMDRTLEAVEGVVPISLNHFERLVVIVTASLAAWHDRSPWA